MMPSPQAATGPLARRYGALVVAFRYLIVLAWIAAIAGAVRYLPALAPAGGVASLVPPNAPALQAEATATRTFGAPLDAEVAIVQRAAHGLSSNAQVSAVRNAAALDTGHARGAPIAGLAGACPFPIRRIPALAPSFPARGSGRPRS